MNKQQLSRYGVFLVVISSWLFYQMIQIHASSAEGSKIQVESLLKANSSSIGNQSRQVTECDDHDCVKHKEETESSNNYDVKLGGRSGARGGGRSGAHGCGYRGRGGSRGVYRGIGGGSRRGGTSSRSRGGIHWRGGNVPKQSRGHYFGGGFGRGNGHHSGSTSPVTCFGLILMSLGVHLILY